MVKLWKYFSEILLTNYLQKLTNFAISAHYIHIFPIKLRCFLISHIAFSVGKILFMLNCLLNYDNTSITHKKAYVLSGINILINLLFAPTS